MKVLVTGASGYIGRHLINFLAERGFKVHAFARKADKLKNEIIHDNIVWFKGDVTKVDTINNAIKGCEWVFHLAAYAGVSLDKDIYFKINVDGTVNILEASLKHGIKKVIYTSSSGALGPSLNGENVDETREHPGIFFNEYEASKHKAEVIVKMYVQKGLDVVIVSPSRIYGPGYESESNAVSRIIDKYLHSNWRWVPGDGTRKGNYVYIDDVVTGHWLALKKGRPGELYILGGHNLSYNEFFDILKEISNNDKKMYKIPVTISMIISYLLYLGAKVSGKKPLITHKWTKRYLHNWILSSEKAISELNYKITDPLTGFQNTIKWLKNNNENELYGK